MASQSQPPRVRIPPPGRILVRGVNWLGDAVMTSPALLRLREAFPAAHISLLISEKLGDLWQNHPAVDSILLFGKEESSWTIGRQLRRDRFDLGLVLPNSPRSAFELWLGGVPVRVGYGAGWRRCLLTHAIPPRAGYVPMKKRSEAEIKRLAREEDRGGLCPVPRPAVPPQAHHLHQYLHLVAALGGNPEPLAPRLFLSLEEANAAGRRLGFALDPASPLPWFGLNAGAEYGSSKRWPAGRFVAAAVEIIRRTPCRWLVLGGPSDVELAAALTSELTLALPRRAGVAPEVPLVLNLAGRTTLRELCAALRACRAVITNDTGPMHLAAAVGTPVIVPFGSTSPELTGPGLPGDPKHKLLRGSAACAPCFLRECPIDLRCLNSISVEEVANGCIPIERRTGL